MPSGLPQDRTEFVGTVLREPARRLGRREPIVEIRPERLRGFVSVLDGSIIESTCLLERVEGLVVARPARL